MPHPKGGIGNSFKVSHTFKQAVAAVAGTGVKFKSTTGESISARPSRAEDGVTETIEFDDQNGRVGNVCEACWGFRQNCSGTWIGQCVEGLDLHLP